MDNLWTIIVQGIVTIVVAWLTVNVIKVRELRQAEKRLRIDEHKSDAESEHELGEAAQTLGANAVNLGESWKKYADQLKAQLDEVRAEFAAYRQSNIERFKEYDTKLSDANERSANQDAVIIGLNAKVELLTNANSKLTMRVAELESENAYLRARYGNQKRMLGS